MLLVMADSRGRGAAYNAFQRLRIKVGDGQHVVDQVFARHFLHCRAHFMMHAISFFQ
mgnify:CR=1 FL=1